MWVGVTQLRSQASCGLTSPQEFESKDCVTSLDKKAYRALTQEKHKASRAAWPADVPVALPAAGEGTTAAPAITTGTEGVAASLEVAAGIEGAIASAIAASAAATSASAAATSAAATIDASDAGQPAIVCALTCGLPSCAL